MKSIIEQKLKPLIGIPLSKVGRSANVVWFCFGEKRISKDFFGNKREVFQYAIHLECSWRIIKNNIIEIGSKDLYVPSKEWKGDDENFEWDIQGNNLFDDWINLSNSCLPLNITNFSVDQVCGIKVFFEEDYVLEIFPNNSTDDECWRFFIPGNLDSHLVITGKGVKEQQE
ncbi:MAG: hypothetical protein ACRKFN_13270 [Desulfitobacterium sp.]